MRHAKIAMLVVLMAACKKPEEERDGGYLLPPDMGVIEPFDAGPLIDAGSVDAGGVRNLGDSPPPVAIDWVLSFQGGVLVENWGVDALGNIALVGSASGVVDFDPTEGVDSKDLGLAVVPVVISLSPEGQYRWSRVWLGRGGGPQPVHVAVAPAGDVYVMTTVTSNAAAPFDMDPTAGTELVDTIDGRRLFVAHLSPTGAYVRGFVTTGSGIVDTPGTIEAGPDGKVWLTGWFQGSVDLDPAATYVVLTSGTPNPTYPRKQFLAQYAADLSIQWALMPSTRSVNGISAVDGGALFSGTYGGGTDITTVFLADLDWGPGLDVHNPGCVIRIDSNACQPQGYLGRMSNSGAVEWTVSYASVLRSRGSAAAVRTQGGPIGNHHGGALILGTTRDTADFDWTSAELTYSAPWHDFDELYDVFAQGVTADGTPRSLTRTRTLRPALGDPEATWTSGTWSPVDETFFATGWTQGAIVFPSVVVSGIGRPAESFLAAFDAKGSLRWATGLNVPVTLGGGGSARVKSAATGRTFLLGSAPANTDIDFTAGIRSFSTGAQYLVAFHPTACTDGTTRACYCPLQVVQNVTASCVNGRPEPCACSQENLQIDGGIPARPTPDCGLCATGWQCNQTTWLCEDPQQQVLVSGLDHPSAVLDDGVHTYYSLQGRYPRTTPPPSQYPVGELWRVPHDGGAPELLADAGAVSGLSHYNGYVYWAQQGLKRTPSAGNGTVETVVTEPLLAGQLAFLNDNAYYARGNQVFEQPLDGGTARTSGVIVSINAIRGISVDSQHVYALTEGANFGGLYRIAHNVFGGGGWQRQTIATDPRAMVQLGSGVYFSDTRSASAVQRFDTISQQVTPAVGMLEGVLNSFSTDGVNVYFTREGLPSARTWTGEVWQVTSTTTPKLLVSSIQHAAGAWVRDGQVYVAEHGETRATTTTGRILKSPMR